MDKALPIDNTLPNENALARNWWAVALRGIAAIAFGVLALVWPDITLVALVLLFGAYALWDGVFTLISGIWRRREDRRWWLLVLEGLVGIAAGIATFVWPGLTAIALVYIIAAWSFITGIMAMAAAIRLRKEIEGEWLMFLSGLLSVIIGVALALLPGPGAIALVWVIASHAIALGILLLALAMKLRNWEQNRSTMATAGAGGAR